MRNLTQLVCLSIIAISSATARAGDPTTTTANEHRDEGTRLYNVQQYDKAADEYQAAYQLDRKPEYLYAIAQSQRLAGNCAKALDAYRAYLQTDPPEDQRAKTEKNIERCSQDLEQIQASVSVAQLKDIGQMRDIELPTVLPPPPRPEEPAMPPSPTRSYLVGHILLGAGVAAIAGGAYFYTKGHRVIEEHNSASTYDEFLATNSGLGAAHGQQTFGMSALAVGSGLVVGGVVYYVLHRRSLESTTVATQVSSGGTMVVLGRSF